MLLQADISLLDLSHFLEQLTPLAVELGDGDGPLRDLLIGRPDRIELIPGQGLRVVTPLRLLCAFAGVPLQVTATSARILLLPAIVAQDGHEKIAFSFVLEAIDLRGMPALFEEKILERINASFARNDAKVSWDFLRTLTFGFNLSARLSPAKRITLTAREGGVRITDEGLHLTVSVETEVLRASLATDGAERAGASPG